MSALTMGPLVERLEGETLEKGHRAMICAEAREHAGEFGEVLGLRAVEEDCPRIVVRLDSGAEVELWSYHVEPEELDDWTREHWRASAEEELGCDPSSRRTRKELDAKIRELINRPEIKASLPPSRHQAAFGIASGAASNVGGVFWHFAIPELPVRCSLCGELLPAHARECMVSLLKEKG